MIRAKPFILEDINVVFWYQSFIDRFMDDYQYTLSLGTFELLLCVNALSYVDRVVAMANYVRTNAPICRCDLLSITPVEYLAVAKDSDWILRCKNCHCFSVASSIYENRVIEINFIYTFVEELLRQDHFVFCYADENPGRFCFCDLCLINKLKDRKRGGQIAIEG